MHKNQKKLDFLEKIQWTFFNMKEAIYNNDENFTKHLADNFMMDWVTSDNWVFEENPELHELFRSMNREVLNFSIPSQYYEAKKKFLSEFPNFEAKLNSARTKYTLDNN